MNAIALPRPLASPAEAPAPAWQEAEVAQALAGGRFRLCDGRLATQAFSCVVTPLPGDRVALLQSASGLYIGHVLTRPDPARVQLGVPGAQTLCLTQLRVELCATEALALRSLGDVELASAGSVALSAQHLATSASGTLVQNAAHLVTHVEHCVLQASALLRIHGQQALLTAEHDLKLDAERISLG